MKKFCLIGNPLSHSFSAQIHSKFGYGYELNPIEPHELEAFVKAKDFEGYNVTIPYKQAVMPLLDAIDLQAQAIGAVNTVVKRDGKLTGCNTDFDGMKYALTRAGISVKGKKVLVLGSGGTSRTACALLAAEGVGEVVVVSRSGETTYADLHKHTDAQIIINTTPVGMYPDNGGQPVDLDMFANLSGVADVVYNPLRTNLILQSASKNIPCTGGLPMLVGQAFFARELFVGTKTQKSEIDAFLKAFQAELTNIVLIGMPCVGKSTVAAELQRKTGRKLIDTDAEIVLREGMDIPSLFAQKGEAYFRATESDVVLTACKQFGAVIATGGGVVLDERSVRALRQSGSLIHIEGGARNQLDGRPLLKSQSDWDAIFAVRKPFYEAARSFAITNDGTAEQTAEIILEKFYESFGD